MTNEERRRRYAEDPVFRAERLAAAKAYAAANRERVNRYHSDKSRRKNTGWTREEFEAAKARQEGRCAVCGGHPGKRGLQADHCHATGNKRDLLCTTCNVWIGAYEKDAELTQKRVAYVKKWKG